MSEDDRIARQMDRAGMDVGIYRKFIVSRTDGSSRVGGKHENCAYFVLDWQHDPFAVQAALAYAKACEATHPALAADLRREADRHGTRWALEEKGRSRELAPCAFCLQRGHAGADCPHLPNKEASEEKERSREHGLHAQAARDDAMAEKRIAEAALVLADAPGRPARTFCREYAALMTAVDELRVRRSQR